MRLKVCNMAVKCPQCGAEFDVTLFTFGRRIRCDCGAWVDLAVGHQQASEDGTQVVSSKGSRKDTSMSSDRPTAAPTHPQRGILWLVVAHAVVGLTVALTTHFAAHAPLPSLWEPVHFGLVFSQVALLGIWGSLGAHRWQVRLIGVLVGVGYLMSVLVVGIGELDSEASLLVVVAAALVTITLWPVRLLGGRIFRKSSPATSASPIQFHIRHLMILTFVVACLVTIGKTVHPHIFHGSVLFELLLVPLVFGIVGVMPVWFVLATRQAVPYGIGLVALGAFAGYCFGRKTAPDFEMLWVTATTTETIAMVVSLLVVRSCGYRLVRLPSRRQEQELVS